jgi:hypothetical protein
LPRHKSEHLMGISDNLLLFSSLLISKKVGLFIKKGINSKEKGHRSSDGRAPHS